MVIIYVKVYTAQNNNYIENKNELKTTQLLYPSSALYTEPNFHLFKTAIHL